MKTILIAAATCLVCAMGAVASVGIDRDKDGYEDGEAVSGYVFTSTYYDTEEIGERRSIVTRDLEAEFEPIRIISDHDVRTRVFLRRTHQNAPNHR